MSDEALREPAPTRTAPSRRPGGVRGPGQRHGGALRRGRRRPAGVLGASRRAQLTWDDSRGPGARLVERPVRQVVRRRHAQRRRTTASTATSRPATATRSRIHFEGEPGDTARHHLRRAATRGVARPPTRCAALGVEGRRPRRDLPADDPRGRRRDARLRAHRRAALGRVRRLLRRGAAQPHRRRRGEARHHRRRRVPARQADAAEAGRRRGRRASTRRRSTCWSCSAPGRRRRLERGRDVWWHDLVGAASRRTHAARRSTPSTRCSSSTPRARPGSRRASCTPPAAT